MPIDDITKTGRQTWKDLQKQNNLDNTGYTANDAKAFRMTLNQLQAPVEPVPFEQLGDFGHSRYDRGEEGVPMWALSDLEDYRAHKQSSLNKMGAGIGKGVALAATTFIDGTLGLLTGTVEGIASALNGAGGYEAVSKLWDNSVSNALKQVNDEMEKILPNYRTQAEQEREWWQNLGTANFWADTFIKNLGFTVGAFYSGQAWNTALKAAGVLKSAASAQVVGSVMSAVNEGRIEANNNSKDFLAAQREQLKLGYDKALADINNDTTLNDYEKASRISELDNTYAQLDQRAQQEADRMGLAVLIGNTAVLSASNLWQFGKLYSRGFDNAKGIMGRIQSGIEREGIKGGVKEGGKYVAETMTKGQMVRRALTNPLAEGFEEMNQAFIAEHAGLFRSSDDPDAYYKALTDPEYEYKTRDWFSSFTEGLTNTYGSGDRWQEFAVGWLTGAIGMPTVGRVNNADANTYLGKGRAVGISGGFLGELRSLNAQNAERQSTVNAMNKFVDNMNQQIGHIVQSNYFTDAMDGWAADQNQFEWTNARDNEMFAGFSAFRKAGRLDDFREIIDQDFENYTQKQLEEIAMNTTPAVELNEDKTAKRTDKNGKVHIAGWRDKKTGQLLSETEEGRQQMRQELTEKRDRIAKALNSYEKALETVRGISNNALSDDETNELAWLKWKQGVFEDRYTDLKGQNDSFVKSLSSAIDKFIYRQSGQLLEETNNERISQGKKKLGGRAKAKYAPLNIAEQETHNMEVVQSYLEALQQSDSPAVLAELLKYSPDIVEYLNNLNPKYLKEYFGIDIDSFNKGIKDLEDLVKISTAHKRFSERYEEFTKDPLKLRQNRDKMDKQAEAINNAVNEVKNKDNIRNMSVQDLVENMDNQGFDLDSALEQFENEPDTKEKLENAKDISNISRQVDNKINVSDASEQAKRVAKIMLDNSKSISNDTEELLDLSRQVYNDPQLVLEQDPSLIEGLSQEKASSYVSDIMDEAKTLLSQIKGNLEEDLADLPMNGKIIKTLGKEDESEMTGHDKVDKGTTANQKAKEREDKAKKEKEDKTSNPNIRKAAKQMADRLNKSLSNTLSDVRLSAVTQELTKLLTDFNTIFNSGANAETIISRLRETVPYKNVAQMLTNGNEYSALLDSELDNYFKELNSTEEEPTVERPNVKDEVFTPEVTTTEANTQINELSRAKFSKEQSPNLIYWKPTITLLPITHDKGDLRPFYEVAKNMRRNGKSMFTQQQLQRIEAVGEYLMQNGAFDKVDKGLVQKGNTVGFKIVSALNEKAGETVILITDTNGNVIGDIMSPNDPTFNRQIGLKAFVENINKEYEAAGSPAEFTSKYTSKIDKVMIGQIPFINDRYSLNEIFTDNGKPIDFKLGIATSDGVSEVIGTPGITRNTRDKIKEVTIPTLSAKKGQPFLLLETADKKGNRQYIPVPFVMDTFNPSTDNTMMSQAITDIVERIINGNSSQVLNLKDALTDLLVIPGLYISYNGDNVIIESEKGRIYAGPRTNQEGMMPVVQQILTGIKNRGFSYQISRKYINGTYNGKSYNRMIGEIAQTNLNIGSTHTVSNWFTINPLDTNGNMMLAESPVTIGINPASKVPQGYQFTWGENTLYNNNNHIYDAKGKEYTGKNADRAKAYSFGLMTNQDMTKPYLTEWGWFNANTMQFVAEPKAEVIKTLGTEEVENKETKGENITSKGSEFAKLLTNPGNNLQVEYKGYTFRNAEHAYQTWKSGEFDEVAYNSTAFKPRGSKSANKQTNYQTMVEILTAKLQQHPELIEGIKERGGIKYLQASTHDMVGDTYWETKTGQNKFIEALIDAYKAANKDQAQAVVKEKTSAEDIMQKSGLLRDKKNLAIWNVLDTKQKDALANKSAIDRNRLLSQLWASFNAASRTFNTDVNTLLGLDKTATIATSEPQKFTAPEEIHKTSSSQENINNFNSQSKEVQDEWIAAGGTPEDFRQDWYEIDQHCKM